ncbi:DUF3099 domain-containing protein [Microbacterium sp. JZ31]|uniref:DUF3099 domain-containing protein n=1 Tax=Microbacterium sp. JZ31 TaxID=1906274 RepID=UPI001EE41BFC|nr:DUF3099 domain-containing protein [Microbacterium sp. JZ31]
MNASRKEHSAQSATSLPVAPADDAGARVRNYLLTMGIRIACLLLMVLVTPYGWYSFVFAAGAIFLPYFAVVGANAASARSAVGAVHPEAAAIEAAAPEAERQEERPTPPTVIRITESPRKPAEGGPDRT